MAHRDPTSSISRAARSAERNGKWVWAPARALPRDLFAPNARRAAAPTHELQARVGASPADGRRLDDFLLEMQEAQHTTFRFLLEPLPDAPVAISVESS